MYCITMNILIMIHIMMCFAINFGRKKNDIRKILFLVLLKVTGYKMVIEKC